MTQSNKNNTPSPSSSGTSTSSNRVLTIQGVAAAKHKFDHMFAALGTEAFTNDFFLNAILEDIKLNDREIIIFAHHIRDKLTKEGMNVRKETVEKMIRTAVGADPVWEGRTKVFERRYQIYIQKSKKEVLAVSNFVLEPKYQIDVLNGHSYYVYDVKIQGERKKPQIILKASDFNKLDILQSQISKQLMGTKARINGCGNYMESIAYKYIDLPDFGTAKQGTALIGLERLESNGPKYFCTPNGIYTLDGTKSEDILYMGNEEANTEEINNLTNLEYDSEKWKEISKEFLSRVIYLQEKSFMMLFLGWMGALPHDYVIRKEVPTNFFPHFMIVAEPGSGKTTLATLLKQFMGHNDSAPRTFPTPFETSKLLNSSYTIPVILDEYGKRWDQDRTNKINAILVECFTKARWSRGTANLNSVYFKYKNPLLFMGQIPPTDQALRGRIIQAHMYKSFQYTQAGKKALQMMEELNAIEDKNFWTGYNIWCANHSNSDVKSIFKKYHRIAESTLSLNDNRMIQIYAIVLVGLHFMKKLADELGVDVGYSYTDIENMYGSTSNLFGDEKDGLLEQFIQDIASYGIAHGNSYGKYFGKKLAVSIREKMDIPPKKSTKYGSKDDKESCVYGQKLLLVKVADACNFLTKDNKKYEFDEIMTFIKGEFTKSMQNPKDPNNLVLAPNGCKIHNVNYTVFNWDKVIEIAPEFENIEWKDISEIKVSK